MITLIALCVFAMSPTLDAETDRKIQSVVKEVKARRGSLKHCKFELSTVELVDASAANFVPLAGQKKPSTRARISVDGDVVVVENLGGFAGAELSPGNPLNEVSSVQGKCPNGCYEFITMPSGGNPLAALFRYKANEPRVQLRIDEFLRVLNVNSNLDGMSIEATLNDPSLKLGKVSDGGFSLESKGQKDGVSYELVCVFETPFAPELVSVSAESNHNGKTTKINRRISYQQFGDIRMPKEIVSLTESPAFSRLDVSLVTPLKFESVGVLNDDFFRRYKRRYSVTGQGHRVEKVIDGTPVELTDVYANRMSIATGAKALSSSRLYYFGLGFCFVATCLVLLLKRRKRN